MMLREAQKRQRKIAVYGMRHVAHSAQMLDRKRQVAALGILNQTTPATPRKLHATDEFVARR